MLGENIGTTFTANIAALAGNAWAKRAARAHLLIKLFGVAWALVLSRPFLAGIAGVTERLNGGDPHNDASVLKWALTYRHFAFNVVNGAVLLQFVPWVEKAATRMVPARNAPDEEFRLEYIKDPIMSVAPALSLMEARMEIFKLGKLCQRMLGIVRDLLLEIDTKGRAVLLLRIAKYETVTDRVELEVGRFLTRTGTDVRDRDNSAHIRGLLSIAKDLENVGDVLFQMSKALERKTDERLWFAPEQRQDLFDMIALLDTAFEVMGRNLEADEDLFARDEAILAEQNINRQGNMLRRVQLKNIESGDHNIRTGMVYSDLFNSCEKVGDHLMNVTEALAGRS